MNRRIGMLAWMAGVATVAVAQSPTGLHGFGYRGDGSCIDRESKPPVIWDETKGGGGGVRWKTDLPNLGLGSPVPAGDRVFVMCEPGSLASHRLPTGGLRRHDLPVNRGV